MVYGLRFRVQGSRLEVSGSGSSKGPKKHISISILWGYPYLIGLLYEGFVWDIPILIFCLCAFLGPYLDVSAAERRRARCTSPARVCGTSPYHRCRWARRQKPGARRLPSRSKTWGLRSRV